MPPPQPYDRAPSPEFLKHLRLAGILKPLLSLAKEKTGGVGLDVHFRRNDEVHVYCGMTRILIAKFLRGRGVRITAHRTHATSSAPGASESRGGPGHHHARAAAAGFAPRDSPYVILTTHCAGWSDTMLDRIYTIFTDNLRHFDRGEPIRNQVDRHAGY